MSTDPSADTGKPATLAMSCPHCKKTTQCREMRTAQEPKPGQTATAHRYICTECKMGWGVQTGGSFNLESLL